MKYECVVIFLLLIAEISGNGKLCNLRDQRFSEEIWNFWAGFWCLRGTNPIRLTNHTYNITYESINETMTIPVAKVNESVEFTFDYNDPNIFYLKKYFKRDSFFEMWKDCCREAEDCCRNQMTVENTNGNDEYPCPAIWDALTCFSPAKAGTFQTRPCLRYLFSTESEICELNAFSEKECFANGTWKQKTNYADCTIAPVLRNRHQFQVICLSIAVCLSFPAIVIFFSMKKFRSNLRYILHRNLIMVIVTGNILSILSTEIIVLDALKNSDSVMASNSVACRVLAFFDNAAKNGMFASMLADGFYLHKMIVRAFADDPSLAHVYIAVGLLSFLPSLAWATARGVRGAADCWMIDETNDHWITDGFRMSIIVINFLLLLDIIRVMATKLKHATTSEQTKATLKATIFLIPLFGLHIVMISSRNIIPGDTCLAEDIYYFISYIIEGLQGVMVALLFCYINLEVRKELRNVLRKFIFQFESQRGRRSSDKKCERDTVASCVESSKIDK